MLVLNWFLLIDFSSGTILLTGSVDEIKGPASSIEVNLCFFVILLI